MNLDDYSFTPTAKLYDRWTNDREALIKDISEKSGITKEQATAFICALIQPEGGSA